MGFGSWLLCHTVKTGYSFHCMAGSFIAPGCVNRSQSGSVPFFRSSLHRYPYKPFSNEIQMKSGLSVYIRNRSCFFLLN